MSRKMQQLFEALRDPEVQNFALAKGEIDGTPAHFIVAEGDDESDDDVPVALLLDKKMLGKLEAAVDALRGDEPEDEDEDEDEPDEDEAPRSSKTYRP
jgi:hypothetical protein